VERAFVLVPWADVDPEFSVPGLGRVLELSSAVDATGVRRLEESLEIPA
jgi:2-amino-4-hydroxy-6-hydroxymethyldihydropteridine diphosphokinase